MEDKNDFQKKIGVGERQYRFGRHTGTTKEILVPREDNGKLAGKQVEHWDGSVDCTVYPPTEHYRFLKKTGEVEPS